MALLKREEWQGFVRDVDWTYSYVDDEAVFPEWHSGTGKVPRAAWSAWEEDYKVSYPEYVAMQRDKEASAYAVKAALQRSSTFEHLDEGWKSATKMHFGGVALVEYAGGAGRAEDGAVRAQRGLAEHGHLRPARRAAARGHHHVLRPRVRRQGPAVRLDAEGVPHQRLGADLPAQPVRQHDDRVERGGHGHRAAVHLRDRVHQPAIRGPGRGRARIRGCQLRQHDLVHPDG